MTTPAHPVFVALYRTPAHRGPSGGMAASPPRRDPRRLHPGRGKLLLPTVTAPRGPVFWVRPPERNALRLCREFDVFAALHTVLRRQLPCDRPVSPDAHVTSPTANIGKDTLTMTLIHLDGPVRADLALAGSQFPLARPVFDLHPAEDVPASAPQPFGLRFFRPVSEIQDRVPFAYRYSPARQVAVTDDGTDTPLITLPIAWDRTTSGITDGKDPGIEEFTMDYCGDR